MQESVSRRRHATWAITVLVYIVVTSVISLAGQQPPPTSLAKALPANATGEQIFRLACATCHGDDGSGARRACRRLRPAAAQRSRLSRLHRLRDQHGRADWPTGWPSCTRRAGPRARPAHAGVRRRADRRRRSQRVVSYLWTFCRDPAWPRGDLNLPRALLHREGVPRERGGAAPPASPARAPGRDQRARLRAPHRLPRPVRDRRARSALQQVEPGGPWHRRSRRRRNRRAPDRSTPATSAAASSPSAAP